ncbi:MAG: hypothetical protein P8011_14880, partial [Acidihalobacter sp.]
MSAPVQIYQSEDGQTRVEVRVGEDTVWLRQEQMSELFGRERSVITKHLRNVFKEGELDEKSNVQNLHIAGSDRPVKFYNLDVIINERIGPSRRAKGERGIWQRRFWDHLIRDEADLQRHVDYTHYNPVKHGHVRRVADWPYSSFHR